MQLCKLRVVYWGFTSFRSNIGDDDDTPPENTKRHVHNGLVIVYLKRDAAANFNTETSLPVFF